jgi:hypothetical protein
LQSAGVGLLPSHRPDACAGPGPPAGSETLHRERRGRRRSGSRARLSGALRRSRDSPGCRSAHPPRRLPDLKLL